MEGQLYLAVLAEEIESKVIQVVNGSDLEVITR
jgi:hypothetical protein